MRWTLYAAVALITVLVTGCDPSKAKQQPETDAGISDTRVHASDVPVDGVTSEEISRFRDGDSLFNIIFYPVDGLGPLYVRQSCEDCHKEGSRGPGLVQKMAVVQTADDVTPAAAAITANLLPYGASIRAGLAAGATTAVMPPADAGTDLTIKVTTRLGPPVLGRGFMEAVADSEIERMEAEQALRSDAIHGHINRVTYTSQADAASSYEPYAPGQTNIIGRFGLKARIATLSDFAADAFQNDMGLTTPLRPTELLNPDGLTDDLKPGVDLDADHVHRLSNYLRYIAIPPRADLPPNGAALFSQAHCDVCHVPSLATNPHYPVTEIAGKPAAVFTDFLLHDMGDALADGLTDGTATSSDWRTSPLIGLRFNQQFLHDGRAHSLNEAIEQHAGEATDSVARFRALSTQDQATLVDYVSKL